MREIKFRAYNKKGKAMYPVWGIHYFDESMTINIFGFNHKPDEYDDSENLILMQYTGFKDEYGREIYEGDIVSNEDYIEDAHCCNDLGNKAVEWSNDGGLWGGMIGEIIKVIGNIHENKELLGGN